MPVTRRVLKTLAEAACSRCSYDAEWIRAEPGMAPLEERFQARSQKVSRQIKAAFEYAHNGTQAVLWESLVEALEITTRSADNSASS